MFAIKNFNGIELGLVSSKGVLFQGLFKVG